MRILICDPISPRAVQRLRDAGLEVDVRDAITPEELVETIPAYDAIVVRSRTKVRQALIDRAANLKLIVRGGVGVDNIDADYAAEKGIQVLNTPAASTVSVAELTLAFLFALARPIVQATQSLREGQWEKKRFEGSELHGKTLGIIGLGRIGTAVAQRAAALGMRVVGYDSRKCPNLPYLDVVSLDDLLAQADYITLHVPLNKASYYMIGQEAFARMKDGVKIVDCARGGIIEEGALYEALTSGKVAGAALDVFENEPPTDGRLFALPQVIGSPHIGANTHEATARIGDEVATILIEQVKELS
jgi:D-3-phosphoglycerate dehydrogenase